MYDTRVSPTLTGDAPLEVGTPGFRPQVEVAPSLRERPAEVVRGTNVLARPPAAEGRVSVEQGGGQVAVNFVDADIREVVRAILGDALGVSYSIDPAVQGTVTLRTSRPVPRAELPGILEDILAFNNAALLRSGDVYRVVPADRAAKSGGGVSGPGGRGVGTGAVVVPLRFVSANEMKAVLEPFTPAGAVVKADTARNVLLLSGGATELATLQEIVATFDVDWLGGMSFAVLPLQQAEPETVVAELEEVFGNQETGPLAGVVRFVPITRLQAVLVITSRSVYLSRAREWIARLDLGDETVARIFVYYCQNSRAADLAETLNEIFSPGAAAAGRQLAPGLRPTQIGGTRGTTGSRGGLGGTTPTFGRSGSSSGTSSGTTDGTTGTGSTGTGLGSTGSTGTGGIGSGVGTAAQRRQQRATGLGGTGLGGGLGGGGAGEEVNLGEVAPVRIIADDVKNALVILATPKDYRLVEAALRKLDVTPLQVLIEATILEVVLNDALRYGVEWFFKSGNNEISLTGLAAGAAAFTPVGPALSGFNYFLNTSDIKVVVNALDQVSTVNMLSSPQLFVLDNETATLQVGDQVPIATQSSTSTITADAPTVNSIEYRDTGVILAVTPRVNSGGLVTLDIVQEVSDVQTQTTSNITTLTNSPTIAQRRIESTVAVQSGGTVALGGLIRDNQTNSSSGVPFLSRIPFIGWLFGQRTDSALRTELLVLLTPRVVSNQEEASRLTEEVKRRMTNLFPLENRPPGPWSERFLKRRPSDEVPPPPPPPPVAEPEPLPEAYPPVSAAPSVGETLPPPGLGQVTVPPRTTKPPTSLLPQ